ncbi:MAG: ComF family protein [Magnetococcus sp. DMHC-6]
MFPPQCPLCLRSIFRSGWLCAECLDQLPLRPVRNCVRCGQETSERLFVCGRCLGNPYSPDAFYGAYFYEGSIRKLIIGLKFSDHTEWAALLVRLGWRNLAVDLLWESSEMVIPMPLHVTRLLKRRFNQSALLAAEFARRLHLPLVTNGLKRTKWTKPQTQLTLVHRHNNVAGAFWADRDIVCGRAILLVDDVTTTGATMASAVKTLKKAGATRVAVVCLGVARSGQYHTIEHKGE